MSKERMSEIGGRTSEGRITIEHTVWCSCCIRWDQLSEPHLYSMIQKIKEMGWRKISNRWVCPECVGATMKGA